jgi:hypothetical protein
MKGTMFMIFLLFFLGLTMVGSGDAKPEGKWVSLSDAKQQTQVGEPGLNITQSGEKSLDIVIKTSGFFVTERNENSQNL